MWVKSWGFAKQFLYLSLFDMKLAVNFSSVILSIFQQILEKARLKIVLNFSCYLSKRFLISLSAYQFVSAALCSLAAIALAARLIPLADYQPFQRLMWSFVEELNISKIRSSENCIFCRLCKWLRHSKILIYFIRTSKRNWHRKNTFLAVY